ncbi:MAG: phage virion morphogenesis protein [Treponema sp.]|uniref:phage virion morphogenesis protein n=1 Tax=Treponema sp. TaxID=166 RepID=UPI003FA23B17
MHIHIKLEERHSIVRNISSSKPLMKELSLMALSTVQKNIEKDITPANAALTQEVKQGNKTLRDTGRLRASLTARHSDTEAVVGTNVPYAQVHNREDGRSETIVRAKNGKSLAIPASARVRTFQRRYGFSAREVIKGLQKDNYSVFRPLKNGKPGNVIFAQKKIISRKTMRGASIPLFILKKSVKIPARPFLFIPDAVLETMLDRVGTYYANSTT